jgi:hypothetical protein
MALGDNNISITAVKGETLSALNTIGGLVGLAGLNKYSRYAPGVLDVVVGSKDITLTPPVNNFKLGDFRRYNHTATTPTVTQGLSAVWYTGAPLVDISCTWAPQELNLAYFPQNGIDTGTTPAHYHVTIKAYATVSDRLAEINCLKSGTFGINMVAHTPLIGHTRQVSWVMNTGTSGNLDRATGQACKLVGVSVPSGDSNRYLEVFFSTSTGDRLINFGTRASNFTTCTCHEYVSPYVKAGAYLATKPSGYTVCYPKVAVSPSDVCLENSQVPMTVGSGVYMFCVKVKGVYGGAIRQVQLTSCNIVLSIPGRADQAIATGVAIGYNDSGYFCSGSLAGGYTWHYDDIGTVTINSEVYGANYSVC